LTQPGEEGKRLRDVPGFLGWAEKVLFIAIPTAGVLFVIDIPGYFRVVFFKQQYLAIFLGLVLASIFLAVPATPRAARDRIPWYDVVMAVMSLGMGLFCSIVYPTYVLTGIPQVGPEYKILGVLEILFVVEATRRTAGRVVVVLVGICLFYSLFTYLFPSPFYGKGIKWDQLAVYLFMDSNGMLGLPLWVSGAIIFAFILFGELLFAVGGSQLLNDFAMATFGRFRGGPAKMAILASGLFGTISGSAVANVAATGVMTIPLMKSVGYNPAAAGAIEAVASTGGQLMPPVMGVTAFILAEFLAIPYAEVALCSIIPAVLYYLAFFIQVDLEAARCGLKGLTEDLPSLGPILKRGWLFAVPLVILVYTLFILNWEPGLSAVTAAFSTFVFSLPTKAYRIGLHGLLNTFERAGRGLLMIGAITSAAGIIIGTVYITGVGSTFSIILLKLGSQHLFPMLMITAVLCIILGMGLPSAALYIILAVLVAPSLVEMGILPLAAHLFIFYFGLMSMITPPVCFATYAGAAIAKADPVKTGFYGVRLGIAAYIIPFIFVYSPSLILNGTPQEILLIVGKSIVALGLVAVVLSGYLFRKLNWVTRGLLAVGALGVLLPSSTRLPLQSWLVNGGGLALCLVVFLREWLEKQRRLKHTSGGGL
jgi:TRAP transporter 4TM/12TM fusion protein